MPQLSLLRSLKLHVRGRCAGPAAPVARHRVPDDAISFSDLLYLIPVFFSFLFKHEFFSYVPLGSAVAFKTPVYLQSSSHNTCHASSKLTGMRGAKAGGSPPRRSPPGIL